MSRYSTEAYRKKSDEYRKTEKGFLVHLYSTITSRVRRVPRYQGLEVLPREEFYRFADCDTFRELHQAYRDSGWERKLAPSVDRIDPKRGYTIDNIRWLTVSANTKRVGKPHKRPLFLFKLEICNY